MLDKIQKIGIWFWWNKERFVLLILVGILGYRVYVIAYPPPPEKEEVYSPPRKEVPDELKPPMPPLPPALSIPGTYAALWRENPFWYFAGETTGSQGKQQNITEKDLGITLLNIRQVGDRWRAQLRTRSTTKWYDEGEEFEQFILEQVNPDDKTIVIYSEQYGRRFTLQMRR